MILLYHNIIADSYPLDRWDVGQGLPLRCFAQQLDWLTQHRRIVSLSEYLKLTDYGTLPARNIIALTFDDGLASTFQRVYPLLNHWQVAATFFVSTAHLEHAGLLWFSYLNALCFDSHYDAIETHGQTLPLRSREQRKQARRSLGYLARLSGDPKEFTNRLENSYPLSAATTGEYEGLSNEQLATFSQSELLECGAHTVNHPFLDQLSLDKQAEEILSSKQQLAELTGRSVRYFAYPKGEYSRETINLVKQLGFEAAFATHYQRVGAINRFEIVRMGIYSLSFCKFWLKAQGGFRVAKRLRLARR